MTIQKYESRYCNGSKCKSSLDVRKCARTRLFLSFSGLLCFLHGHKNRSKSSKILHKIITKNARPGFAMVKNGSRRATCTNAAECVHFSRSRCSFVHTMDAKIAKNRTCYGRARREAGQFEVYIWRKIKKLQIYDAYCSILGVCYVKIVSTFGTKCPGRVTRSGGYSVAWTCGAHSVSHVVVWSFCSSFE